MSKDAFPPWLIVLSILAVLFIGSAGVWFYVTQKQMLREDAEANLSAIAELKVGQIAAWRANQLQFAAERMSSPFTRAALLQWLADPQAVDREALVALFREWQKHHHFCDVALIDAAGLTRLSLRDDPRALHADAAEALDVAFRERRPVLTDLHRGPGDLPPHLDIFAPLFAEDGRPAGVLLLRSDARQFLYPLIQSWPVPSQSAETLLVRRDDDAALFLNDLRFRPNAALNLRLPLTATRTPAVLAALGYEGVIQRGIDYRNVEVLAVVRAIPDSPWFMVAKVDAAEAFAPWRFRSLLIIIAYILALAVLGAGVALVWQTQQRAHYQALSQAEARHRTTLLSVGDAVIVTDAAGRVELLNPVAEALTGWPLAEAAGRPIGEVFHIINEQTRQPVEDPVARVRREGIVVGLANHTLLVARDGSERPIADSGAPVHDAGGRLSGAVLVFRDQTQERAAQIELMTLAARQEAILASVPDIIMEVDNNTVYTWANQAGLDFFGPDVIGRKADYYFEGEQETYQRVQPLFNGNENVIYVESWQRRRDGQKRLLAWWCRVLKDAKGEAVGALSTARDITPQRQAEEARRESEEKHRLLLDNARLGVGYFTLDGTVALFNQMALDYMGGRLEDFVGKSMRELFGEEQDAEYMRRLQLAAQSEGSQEYEDFIALPTGSRWFLSNYARVCNVAGKVIGVQIIFQDITERKRAEQELRRSQEQLARYLRIVESMILVLDMDSRVVLINRKGCEILGWSQEEIVGKDWFENFIPERIRAEMKERCGRIMRGEADVPTYFENPVLTRRGEERLIAWHNSILRDESEAIMGTISSCEDITERRQTEEERTRLQAQLAQAQKMEAIGRLAGGVAHDFNNMLQAILGYADLGLDCVDPDSPVYDYLLQVRAAGQRSADLTRQLLAFARRQTINPKVLDVNDTLAGMLKMLRRLIGEDIELVWKPGPNLWNVRMDPSQLDQVLANLAVNARDAIAGVGRVTIETANVLLDADYCSTHAGSAPGEYVLLAISDTGAGMTPEVLEHAFEPFFTTKEPGKGTGMGLATVYGIVKQNNGLIYVYSEPGQGATIKIYLPRFQPEEKAGNPAEAGVQKPPRGSETVLIVEDEEAILKLGRRILEYLGYAVLTANSPQEALRLAGEHAGPIHLLITDVVMPGMHGRQLAERLAAVQPGLRCLYMSGYTTDVIAHRGVLDAGMYFIQKPFSTQTLAEKVRQVLDDRSG